METENETFWPNIRRYLSLPPTEQARVATPKPECGICLSSTLKCYPLNNYGPLVTTCPKTGDDLERMVILYCGHVVGYDCIVSYLSGCYRNYKQSGEDTHLPRCPTCRDSLVSDCERPYVWEDEAYCFITPFAIAPSGPPIAGQPEDARENYDADSPVHFNVLDEGIFKPIAFSFNRWENIPFTRTEGGILPQSCRCCEEDIYEDAVRRYREQQIAIRRVRQRRQEQAAAEERQRLARQQAQWADEARETVPVKEAMKGRRGDAGIRASMKSANNPIPATGEGSMMAFKSVQIPRSSIFDATPNRPRQVLWPLGYCVVVNVPVEDGTGRWEQRRMRVATRMMYNGRMDNGMSVEIPLEPRCFGPPQWGPVRFGRHPVASPPAEPQGNPPQGNPPQ